MASDFDACIARLRQAGLHVVDRCFYAPRGWLARRVVGGDESVWVYPQDERWRLHLTPYGTGLHWVRDVRSESLVDEVQAALLVNPNVPGAEWRLELTWNVRDSLLLGSLNDPAALACELRTPRSEPFEKGGLQFVNGLVRQLLAAHFRDAVRSDVEPEFGIVVVRTEAELDPLFAAARERLEDSLGPSAIRPDGVEWRVGELLVALLHADSIGNEQIDQGKTIELRVCEPSIVPDPRTLVFSWPRSTSRTWAGGRYFARR